MLVTLLLLHSCCHVTVNAPRLWYVDLPGVAFPSGTNFLRTVVFCVGIIGVFIV